MALAGTTKDDAATIREDLRRKARDLTKKHVEKKRKEETKNSNPKKRGRSTSGGSSRSHSVENRHAKRRDGKPTPPAKAFAAAAAGSSTAQEEEAKEEGEVPQGELSNDLIQSAEREQTGSAPKRTKNFYKWVLFVNGGDEDRAPVTKEMWHILTEKLSSVIVEKQLNGEESPDIDWLGYKNKVGIIACVDEHAHNMMKQLILDTPVAEYKFRGWAQHEVGKYRMVTIPIPAELKSQKPGRLIQALVKVNNLPETYLPQPTEEKGGRKFLKIRAENDFIEKLFSLERVKLGMATVTPTVEGKGAPTKK